jgi:hypothetical protein
MAHMSLKTVRSDLAGPDHEALFFTFDLDMKVTFDAGRNGKRMPPNRRAKCRQTRYPDPKPATLHETGASPGPSLRLLLLLLVSSTAMGRDAAQTSLPAASLPSLKAANGKKAPPGAFWRCRSAPPGHRRHTPPRPAGEC